MARVINPSERRIRALGRAWHPLLGCFALSSVNVSNLKAPKCLNRTLSVPKKLSHSPQCEGRLKSIVFEASPIEGGEALVNMATTSSSALTDETITSASAVDEVSTSVTTAANTQITPFIISPDCPRGWQWHTSFEGNGPRSQIVTTHSSLLLQPTDMWLGCMPSAWNSVFEFNPGVCPEDWTAYDIATTLVSGLLDHTTAYCCPGGYTLGNGDKIGMAKACANTWTTSAGAMANITVVRMPNRANSGPTTRTFEYGEVVQPAWHLSWAASDTRSLHPPPPSVTGSSTIATWVPPPYAISKSAPTSNSTSGMWPLPTWDNRQEGEYQHKDNSLLVFMCLVTIIPCCLIFSCIGCWRWVYVRNRRKEIIAQCNRDLHLEIKLPDQRDRESDASTAAATMSHNKTWELPLGDGGESTNPLVSPQSPTLADPRTGELALGDIVQWNADIAPNPPPPLAEPQKQHPPTTAARHE